MTTRQTVEGTVLAVTAVVLFAVAFHDSIVTAETAVTTLVTNVILFLGQPWLLLIVMVMIWPAVAWSR